MSNPKVLSNTRLKSGAFSLVLEWPEAGNIRPGTFLHVKCGEERLLRRPISICETEHDRLRMIFEVRGEGTKWLSECKAGDCLDVLGPLGNGFDVGNGRVIVAGGGIGVPPMLGAARAAGGRATAVAGFRSEGNVMLEEELRSVCEDVSVTTDDGTYGEHGAVTLPLSRLLAVGGYDKVLACGPKAMLRAVAEICATHETGCYVSLEERMGCGIGACLVCACNTIENGEVQMRRVCKDGPVFDAREVVW